MSQNGDRGALPEELRDVDTGTLVIQHERRVSNLETENLEIRASMGRLADGVGAIHKDLGDIKLLLATQGGERKAVSDITTNYVRPVIVTALVAVLGMGLVAFAGRTPTASQVAAEVVKQMQQKGTP